MFMRKMARHTKTSLSGLENGLIPYADIRDDYMTFFAFHGIILGAFLGVVGYNQFFSMEGGSGVFSLVPALMKIAQQWEEFDLWPNLFMIFFLMWPVISIWLCLDSLIRFLREISGYRSVSFLVLFGRTSRSFAWLGSGAAGGAYLALCIGSLKGAVFVLVYFGLNVAVLFYIILANIMPGRRKI